MHIHSLTDLFDLLPEEERIITDVLRQIIIDALPSHCIEKLTYGVPYFYGKRRMCLVWPATIKGGGIKQGVLLGFSYGKLLNDEDDFLTRGTNKQLFYKIYRDTGEIDERPIIKLLKEAVRIDGLHCK